jgi:hypothetical protein
VLLRQARHSAQPPVAPALLQELLLPADHPPQGLHLVQHLVQHPVLHPVRRLVQIRAQRPAHPAAGQTTAHSVAPESR